MPNVSHTEPHICVSVLELRDLKHSGRHSVILEFRGKVSQSGSIEGFGSFKRVEFSSTFKLPTPLAANQAFWDEHSIRISVLHERFLFDDKVVGECEVPICGARMEEMKDWFPLWYKGGQRGAVKISVLARNVAVPAASATVLPSSERRAEVLASRDQVPVLSVSSDWPT